MRPMRRKDREMPENFALNITDKCAYVVLATVSPDGSPYCVPLSMAREEEWLYFHSAKEGHKIDNLRLNNKVCIVCVGDVEVIPGEFSTEFESAVIFGRAEEINDREEKIMALRIISERYTPDNMAAFNEAINRQLDLTSVWKIHIDEISGKRKKIGKDGKELKYGKTE